MIETYRGLVYPRHLDHMGHMNVQYYTARFDEATWHMASRLGLTLDYINRTNTGMAALQQTTHYKAEVSSGALLVIRSGIIEVRTKTIRFFHRMYNAESGVEAATSELVGAHLDRKARKAIPLPAFVEENAAAFMIETER
ncbi:MAG: thioesterase [Alphaproteobacteria bacterium]|nr:thioesterase [Alphaproteobacteria bacterium]